MQNEIVNPVIPVQLDRPRNLRITFNTLVEIEKETGKSIMDQATWQNLGVRDLRVILWAALKHEDPDLTIEDVGRMLGPQNMETVANAIGKAFEVSLARRDQSPLAATKTEPEEAHDNVVEMPLAAQPTG
jgi:hypothetical protein